MVQKAHLPVTLEPARLFLELVVWPNWVIRQSVNRSERSPRMVTLTELQQSTAETGEPIHSVSTFYNSMAAESKKERERERVCVCMCFCVVLSCKYQWSPWQCMSDHVRVCFVSVCELCGHLEECKPNTCERAASDTSVCVTQRVRKRKMYVWLLWPERVHNSLWASKTACAEFYMTPGTSWVIHVYIV